MRSPNDQSWMPVCALALFDGRGRLLLQQRPAKKRHAGLWEFPGGKVEPGETLRQALVREIAEELSIGLDLADLDPALFAEEPGSPPIVLLLYTASCWTGEVRPTEGQACAWLSRSEAACLDLAPMDRSLLARLTGWTAETAGQGLLPSL